MLLGLCIYNSVKSKVKYNIEFSNDFDSYLGLLRQRVCSCHFFNFNVP